jgi:hypothetical protein
VTTTKRDLSAAQFAAQCTKLGFKPQGFLGYYDLGLPKAQVCVSVLNAGNRRRDQLAYLLAKRKAELRAAIAKAEGR